MRYPVEPFTDEEKQLLTPHFTNLDRPVFALVNLPETVKGALFARYSRYPGTLRRLYLEEFASEVPPGGRPFEGAEGERAAGLYERVFLGYGDDSIAQVGGRTWPASGSRTSSPRCSSAAASPPTSSSPPATSPTTPRWRDSRAAATATTATTTSAPTTRRRWTSCSRSTRARSPPSRSGRPSAGRAATTSPNAPGRARSARRRSSSCRGLLPAATLSHVGIFASGQAYEQLLLRMMASPLPEARGFAEMILEELKKVMPTFVSRVERPERGGEWIGYLEKRREATERWVARLGLDRPRGSDAPSVELVKI